MGDIYGNYAFFRQGYTIDWIDTNHYLFPDGVVGEVGKEELFRAINLPSKMFFPSDEIFLGH